METNRSPAAKRKTMDNVMVVGRRNNFVEIPLDLVIEIFSRLPVKSVAKFLAVSKSYARLIRSRDFMTSFPYRSYSYQPRVLVAFIDIDRQNSFCQKWYLFSLSSSSSTSFVSCVTFPHLYPVESEYNAHYVNGLIIGSGRKQQFITNPSAGKCTHLPSVEIRTKLFTKETVRSFFGYDSVNDDYKVLCMSENVPFNGRHLKSSQHQVHTLGDKQEPWRKITCSVPHHSFSNGHVCIDGVVYYVAYTGTGLSQLCLMRFDLKFETLDLFTILPLGIGPLHVVLVNLMNYKGKVALPVQTSTYTYEVWIVDQDSETHVWSKKSFSIEPWKDLIKVSLHITGTTRTGEIILAPMHCCEDFSVLYYNPDTNYFCNCSLNENKDYEVYEFHFGTRAIVFPDYVESVRLL